MDTALSLLLVLVLTALYFVPVIVAAFRSQYVNVGAIIVINILLGWTFIGWVVALAMACKSRPRPVQVQYAPPPRGMVPPPGY